MKIEFFWTGAAYNLTLDNTHFLIQDWDNHLFVDCGWGILLSQKILREEVPTPRYFFITHIHPDHLFGFFHIIRTLKSPCTFICSQKVHDAMWEIAKYAWILKWIKNPYDEWIIRFEIIEDNIEINLSDWKLRVIDVISEKEEQHWFRLNTNNKTVLFFWDEASWVLKKLDLEKFKNPDIFICDAFCTEDILSKFPHIKNEFHSTSKHAGIVAQQIDAKKLFLIHNAEIFATNLWIDDKQRILDLKNEASKNFDGEIFVPKDWTIFD